MTDPLLGRIFQISLQANELFLTEQNHSELFFSEAKVGGRWQATSNERPQRIFFVYSSLMIKLYQEYHIENTHPTKFISKNPMFNPKKKFLTL